ncbi:hypothetical protein GCM10017044_18080 [Kordiimonas sediminis]|uniref:Uncharacterized protein n=1 Tax=Kordiimonas sediminis TaxID=1735581 RepID=A0A919AS84_9PROT|nr:hypothetical protein [Kordiimonas sediminis]GHF23896.1 hypothetical protein GCM10017044_18080 [Kordiimonas sediminis]
MLTVAAIMLLLVGAMHSLLGGKRLIAPILRREDLPVILGSVENTKITLWAGWHALTLFWWAQAAGLLTLAYAPEHFIPAILGSTAIAAGIMGICAIILSKGRHKSWIFFLPLAFTTGYLALEAIDIVAVN